MQLAIFGATGATGRELVRQGLEQGHRLTCLVRDPAAAKLPAAVVQIKGDARDEDPVARAIAGSDAVLSALGSRSLRKGDLLDCAIANILAGMKKNGVRRIVVLGAAGAVGNALKYQSLATRFGFAIVVHAILKYPFLDQKMQELRLEASDLDYTIVRPPRLTDGPYTGRYRVEADSLPKAAKSTSRADVAEFMLKQLGDRTFLRRGVYVAR